MRRFVVGLFTRHVVHVIPSAATRVNPGALASVPCIIHLMAGVGKKRSVVDYVYYTAEHFTSALLPHLTQTTQLCMFGEDFMTYGESGRQRKKLGFSKKQKSAILMQADKHVEGPFPFDSLFGKKICFERPSRFEYRPCFRPP